MLAVININEVTHLTIIKYPVIKIAANAGGEKTESNLNQSLLYPAKEETSQNHHHGETRNRYQLVRMPGEHSKGSTVVRRHYKPQETIYD